MAQPAFFIFGQGHRRKLLYQHGTLVDLNAGTILLETEPAEEVISDSDYTVSVRSKKGESIIICENQSGIQLDYNEQHTILDEGEINLPSFTLHPYQRLLRILHHEILINIVDGYPVPNFLVYNKPWYRDAAMMAMVLEKTGNTCLLQKWIGSLDELYDRNNAGCEEPDNLGQLLYLISLLDEPAGHPLIRPILDETKKITRNHHLTGLTDFQPHPIYQTKWLKYGLRRLGLQDIYHIPEIEDGYAGMCWWDRAEMPTIDKKHLENDRNYPYLSWAEAHFFNTPPPLHLARESFPLTWETHASQAQYEGMQVIDTQYTVQQTCAPHTWHAAEMFLYLFENNQDNDDSLI